MSEEVNETMEEAMDTSPPDAETKHCSESESNSLLNGSTGNGHADMSTDSDSSESDDEYLNSEEHETNNQQQPTPTVPKNDIENKINEENGSNSNGSYQNARSSTQNVSEENDKIDCDVQTISNETDKKDNSTMDTNGDYDSSEDDIDSITNTEEDGTQKLNDSDVIVIENSPEKQNGKNSSDVQDSTNDSKVKVTPKKKPSEIDNMNLRRSSRKIIKKHYDSEDDNSDIEVIPIDDSKIKSKPIFINDTKKLYDMANKTRPNNRDSNQTQLVIINSNSRKESPIMGKANQNAKMTINSVTAQSLYQSITARGTTVTPVPAPTPQPAILPSLTDDMYVVEAPSFIVPYVYEKPSIKPFREFVDILGKNIEDKAKEQKLLQAKERKEKKQESREKGESVSESDEESDEENGNKEQKKKSAKGLREHDDDDSWEGESSDDFQKDSTSDFDSPMSLKTINSSTKADSVTNAIGIKAKSDNYFTCSLGTFFTEIGTSLVQEYVQTDLLKQQNRKLHKEKKAGHSTKETLTAINSLTNNIKFSKENNSPYSFALQKCEFCNFKTESTLVMANHLESPHLKNNLYHCNFCEFSIRGQHDILLHMQKEHGVRGKIERMTSYHPCENCPFEDNGKGKLARHMVACAKRFKPETNLAPPVDWEPPAKLPKIIKPKNQPVYPINLKNLGMSVPRQIMNLGINNAMRNRPRAPTATGPRPHFQPVPKVGNHVRNSLPTPLLISNYHGTQLNNKAVPGKSQPSLSITPVPRAPLPTAQTQQPKGTFVICEICDGYIKDLEQLRNHMQWIHKVKIHPKMIYNRPPLNCQKCQFRFFTDQGLERHLLGTHGLVTSSMQEAANKGKDAGRCPVCGRVYQWKLLNHVATDHKLSLKPAHLSYKCTVCTATFGMYKQFENHVYSVHRVVAKRVMDKNKIAPPAAKPANDSLLKPLKISDEITIIPQQASQAPTSSKAK